MAHVELSASASHAVNQIASLTLEEKNRRRSAVDYLGLTGLHQFIDKQCRKFQQQKCEVIQAICLKAHLSPQYLNDALQNIMDLSPPAPSKWFKRVILSQSYFKDRTIVLTMDLQELYLVDNISDEVIFSFLERYEKSSAELDIPASILFALGCIIYGDLACLEHCPDESLLFYNGVRGFFINCDEISSAALFAFAKYYLADHELRCCGNSDDNLRLAIIHFIDSKIHMAREIQALSRKA